MAGKDILIIVPTRNRPNNIKRLWESYKRCTTGNSYVVLMADTDDDNDYSYTGWKVERHPRMTCTEKLNYAACHYDSKIIGFLGDDTEIETIGFEDIVISKLEEYYSMLRPSNGYDIHKNPDHIFITRNLYLFLGWFAYPQFFHGFIDHVWLDVGRLLNEGHGKYEDTKDIIIRHHHWLYEKVEIDDIYKAAYKAEMLARDSSVFKNDWPRDLEQIKKRISTVDLLMVTHNRLEYLIKSLDSLLKQSYKDFILTIWDNASDKNVVDYLDTIIDHRVRVIKSPANDSLASVTNRIFGSSKKHFVGKVDPDIILPPDWLERCITAHRQVASVAFPVPIKLGFIGGFHFRPEDLEGIEPKIEELNGVRLWRKTHIGGCAFIIERSEFRPYDGEGLFGLTEAQHDADKRGLHNGYLWDPILYVEHMEDARSSHCIKTKEYQDYKIATRGQTIEQYTHGMYINNQYLKENAKSV